MRAFSQTFLIAFFLIGISSEVSAQKPIHDATHPSAEDLPNPERPGPAKPDLLDTDAPSMDHDPFSKNLGVDGGSKIETERSGSVITYGPEIPNQQGVVVGKPFQNATSVHTGVPVPSPAVGPLGGNFGFGVLHVYLPQDAVVTYKSNHMPSPVVLDSRNDHRLLRSYQVVSPSAGGELFDIKAYLIGKDGRLTKHVKEKRVAIFAGQQSELVFLNEDFPNLKGKKKTKPGNGVFEPGPDKASEKDGGNAPKADSKASPRQATLTWKEVESENFNTGWSCGFTYTNQGKAIISKIRLSEDETKMEIEFSDARSLEMIATSKTEDVVEIEGGNLFLTISIIAPDGANGILVDQVRIDPDAFTSIDEINRNGIISLDSGKAIRDVLHREVSKAIQRSIGDPRAYALYSQNGAKEIKIQIDGSVATRLGEKILRYNVPPVKFALQFQAKPKVHAVTWAEINAATPVTTEFNLRFLMDHPNKPIVAAYQSDADEFEITDKRSADVEFTPGTIKRIPANAFDWDVYFWFEVNDHNNIVVQNGVFVLDELRSVKFSNLHGKTMMDFDGKLLSHVQKALTSQLQNTLGSHEFLTAKNIKYDKNLTINVNATLVRRVYQNNKASVRRIDFSNLLKIETKVVHPKVTMAVPAKALQATHGKVGTIPEDTSVRIRFAPFTAANPFQAQIDKVSRSFRFVDKRTLELVATSTNPNVDKSVIDGGDLLFRLETRASDNASTTKTDFLASMPFRKTIFDMSNDKIWLSARVANDFDPDSRVIYVKNTLDNHFQNRLEIAIQNVISEGIGNSNFFDSVSANGSKTVHLRIEGWLVNNVKGTLKKFLVKDELRIAVNLKE